MADYVWTSSERRDLYLASRLLAGRTNDGDWIQWASDTLLQDLELYDDPRQGVGSWLFADEVSLVEELGVQLWRAVQSNPFNAPESLADAAHSGAMQAIASRLVRRMEDNGRRT
jgi:hypothetical protein